MAITLTAAELMTATRMGEPHATRLLAVASELVTDYAPDAPDVIQNEAVIRMAGYLYGSDYGGIRSESIGPQGINYATNHAAAFRYSGAAGLLTRYKRRRAGKI